MKTGPNYPRRTSTQITRHRTAALLENGVNFNRGASAQFKATIVVHAVLLVQAEEPYCAPKSSAWTACHNQRDTRQRHRRVFVPTVQLLREQLPEPDV